MADRRASPAPRDAAPPDSDRSTTAAGYRRPRADAVVRAQARQGSQLAVNAGTALVSAARVGRLLGRTSWRIARQLPGVDVVEQQAERLRHIATTELLKVLDVPQAAFGGATADELRAMLLVHNGSNDAQPLRSAMSELLHRGGSNDRSNSRDYLYGTIVSQLVPDEARILAALAGGQSFASVDVVAKPRGRGVPRTVLANVSTVGLAAGLASPGSVATYLGRLHGFGLVEVNGPDDALTDQYDLLTQDEAVVGARAEIDHDRRSSPKIVRRSVRLSHFGREFWRACAPAPSALDTRRP